MRLTERVKVATKAHTKLCHMVLFVKLWLISSIAKSTPPIGEPKATATPAALAAVKISLILAARVLHQTKSFGICRSQAMPRTMTRSVFAEDPSHDASYAARDVDGRAFFSY